MTQLPEQSAASGPELLTAKQVGEALGGIHVETIRRWARENKIAHITLPSGSLRFRRETVDKILAGQPAVSAA